MLSDYSWFCVQGLILVGLKDHRGAGVRTQVSCMQGKTHPYSLSGPHSGRFIKVWFWPGSTFGSILERCLGVLGGSPESGVPVYFLPSKVCSPKLHGLSSIADYRPSGSWYPKSEQYHR